MILDTSIKIKNYKCFGADQQGFERIYPINIIIGKNNSGKSSLIDLIEFTSQPNSQILEFGRKEKKSEVLVTKKISQDEVALSFPNDRAGGNIPGSSYYDYGKQFIQCKLEYILSKGEQKKFVKLDKPFVQEATDFFQKLLKLSNLPFKEYDTLLRINAERDIIPESGGQEVKLLPNGSGATTLIQSIINNIKFDSALIEKTLLTELNKIINPEMDFIDLVVQVDTNLKWEIYLEEKENGRIPLSKMGSGIKTIILVLLNLYVVPRIERNRINKNLFGFEELENNLHPTLLRKLFNYLNDFAITNDSYFFITTHSSLVIDLFANNPNAQILHTTKSGDSSFVTSISSHSGASVPLVPNICSYIHKSTSERLALVVFWCRFNL
jgi:putative ATP-dependent endonuclease of the OLD family